MGGREQRQIEGIRIGRVGGVSCDEVQMILLESRRDDRFSDDLRADIRERGTERCMPRTGEISGPRTLDIAEIKNQEVSCPKLEDVLAHIVRHCSG
jgi:hypothetical protein